MAIIKTSSSAQTPNGIERNSFDYIQAYASLQCSNPTVVSELVAMYVLIANNLGITPFEFITQVKNQGNSQQQAIYIAAQMNSVRVRNALIGVAINKTTPEFINREIAA